jgi:hypothetical protein
VVVFQSLWVPNRRRGTMLKITSWHFWAAAAIGIAAVLTTIFDPSALILITLFFVLCVYIVVRIKKGKFTS